MASPVRGSSPIALGALAHDPDGRLLGPFERALPILRGAFRWIALVVTPGTAEEWTRRVWDQEAIVLVRSKYDEVGENRREALSIAQSLEMGTVQYADLDRAIHWALTQPQELTEVANIAGKAEYTVIGRTEGAMASHPQSQRLPELVTNRAVSTLLGQELDITSGSCAMSRATASRILQLSKATGVTTDAEWPMLAALTLGHKLSVVLVDGLDFETADYNLVEIQEAGGLTNWIRARYETITAWRIRAQAAQATIAAAEALALHAAEVKS